MSIKNSRNVNGAFAEWAKNISGMVGGNPNGDIWFCGIEFGGDEKERNFDNPIYDDNKGVFPYWDDNLKEIYPEYPKWQYWQKQAKIVCYIKDPIANWRKYLRVDFLSSNGDTFSMNLFPINFQNTSHEIWSKQEYLDTGFPTKTEYIAWCIQNRFPSLKELVYKYSPKVLICTGSSFRKEFLLAFSEEISDIYEKMKSEPLPNKKKNE